MLAVTRKPSGKVVTPLAMAALVLLVCWVYWPGLGGGFAFDDHPNIVDNLALRVTTLDPDAWLAAAFSSPSSELRRPLAMVSFALNQYFTGLDPVSMKLTNIVIHAINALLVFGLVRALLLLAASVGQDTVHRRLAALFAASAWALHPINVMAVLLVVQRMESLSHTFVFAGLWLYLVGRRRQIEGRPGWTPVIGGLIGGTAFGILAKESAVLLPLYAFCVELCLTRFRGAGMRREAGLHWLFAVFLAVPAALGIAWLLPRVLASGAYAFRPFTLGERLLTEPRVVLDYLQWTLWPNPGVLSLYHDDYPISHGLWQPPSTLLAILACAGLIAVAFAIRRRRPLTALGLLWFFGAQSLTATFLPLELVYEHRNYFASLGICLALADLLLIAPKPRMLRLLMATSAVAVLAYFTLATHIRAREWSNPYLFASTEAIKHRESPRATYAVAQTLTIMSGYRADSPHLESARAAMQYARRVPGSGALPVTGLILIAANTGQPQRPEWWRELQDKLRRGPIGPQEISALQSLNRCALDGKCMFPQGALGETYRAALSWQRHPDLLTLYASYLWNQERQFEAAGQLWSEVVEQRPDVAQYRINLVRYFIATGQRDRALQEIAVLRRMDMMGEQRGAANALDARAAALPRMRSTPADAH